MVNRAAASRARFGCLATAARRASAAILLLALLASPCLAQPASYPFSLEGRVVSVTDGDTIKILRDDKQYRIRLNGIDAPEMGQAFGRKAKEALASLVAGKEVEVVVRDTDRYGRYVGDVIVDGKSACALLVAAGLAWHYLEYSKDETLAALEKAARENKLGLWADAQPIPPWEFRRHKRSGSK